MAQKKEGFSPCSMSKPDRNASPIEILRARTFFVTTSTCMERALLQSKRNATLFIDGSRSCVSQRKFHVHDFVVMPNHVHLLITVDEQTTEFGYSGDVWQRGFSDVRIEDRVSFLRHQQYIAQNPIKKGLADAVDEFPYCFANLARRKVAGAKARNHDGIAYGTTKVVP